MRLTKKIFLSLLPIFVHAQNTESNNDLNDLNNIEIVDEKPTIKKERTLQDFLTENLSGEVGSTVNIGSDNSNRSYSYAKFGLNHTYNDWLYLKFSAIAESTKIKTVQKKESNYSNHPAPEEKTLNYKKNELRILDAYVDAELNNYFSLAAGQKTIVWGQFEPFSPNNFAMPLNLSSTGASYSKVSNTLSQPFISLTFSPTSRIILESYFFPKITADSVVDETFNSNRTYQRGTETYADVDRRPTGSDEHQYGARLMYYPDWGTMGFTYFDGYDSNFPIEEDKIVSSGNKYYVEGGNGYSTSELIGFEIAIPDDNWTYLFEFSRYKREMDLQSLYINNQTSAQINMRNQSFVDFFNWSENTNNGKLWVPVETYMAAIGADVTWDNWALNAGIFFMKDVYSGNAQKGYELSQKNGSDESDSLEIFPTFHLVKDYGKSKWGTAGGLVGTGTGVLTYYEREITTGLVADIGLNYIDYLSDQVLSDKDDNGVRYESESSFGVLASVRYSF